MMKYILILISIISSSVAYSHSGGTDSFGCHKDNIHGGYHCHNGHYKGMSFNTKEDGFDYIQSHGSKYKHDR